MTSINYLAVIVAAIIPMILGALWYSPMMFAKPWLALIGKKAGDMESMKKDAPKGYAAMAVGALLMAYVLERFVIYAQITTVYHAITLAIWIWLAFIASTALSLVMFEGRKFKLFAINTGYYLVALILMSILLALWR